MTGPDPGSDASGEPVLVVDLDGTLIRTDLLIEGFFHRVGRDPAAIVRVARAWLRGRAALKAEIAPAVALDPATLPYNCDVLDLIDRAREDGRGVYLVSASNERHVGEVAGHLGMFDGWFGSSDTHNLGGRNKAAFLVERFGAKGFDYVGDTAADLPVWRQARHAYCVGATAATMRRLRKADPAARFLPSQRGGARIWAKALRVHQWVKNGLIVVPLVAAHRFDPASLLAAVAAFVAFSLCASSVYVVNDAVDLADDRSHRTKHARPLASGAIPLAAALLAVPLLLAAAFAVAASVSLAFVGALFGYLVLTTAYSFWLKRKLVVDVVVLGMLYTLRIVGGAVAIGVTVSEWLLAFSMFLFLSLALIKRYVELATLSDTGRPGPANRNYRSDDLVVISGLAAAAGFNAVTVFALWISSPIVRTTYAQPQFLWLICPLMLYWFARALILAHRRLMHDDPIVFALRDRVSVLLAVMIAVIFGAAIW